MWWRETGNSNSLFCDFYVNKHRKAKRIRAIARLLSEQKNESGEIRVKRESSERGGQV